MTLLGHILNGVIFPDQGFALPDGAVVSISYPAAPSSAELKSPSNSPEKKQRVDFPRVRNGEPGSLDLTNDMLAEYL